MLHVLRRRALSRRQFLRGASAAVALPFLDAMVPALASRRHRPGGGAPLSAPRRCVFVFAPNGKKMDDWTPGPEGAEFEWPHILEPLAPYREQVLVLSGLALDGARSHGDGPGDHARACAAFLTGVHPRKTGGDDIRVGTSIDQVIAARVGAATRFPSLELGMEAGRRAGSCDSGYSCAYSSHVSWRTPTTPVAKEVDPREAFSRLFGDPDAVPDPAARARDQRRRQSVVDAVRADAADLTRRLGPADRHKLDEYLTALAEFETRLARAEDDAPPVEVPEGLRRGRLGFTTRLALMYELIALAFRADLTRTATFMLGDAGSNRSYRFLDVPDGHHDLSHHRGDPDKLAKIRKINRFHVEQLAAFLGRLRATPAGGEDDGGDGDDGGLLEHTLCVYGSGIADGNQHAHHDLPVLVAGGGLGGARGGGRHLRFPKDTPLANLYVAIMRHLGLGEEPFGDSDGVLDLG